MRKVLIPVLVLLVAAGAFARGGQEAPPEVGVGSEETVYLSPQASPGVQDTVTIPISVTADASRNDVVVAYTINIADDDGTVVWTESGQNEYEEPGFFGRIMQNLGLRDRETTVTVPESRDWDGTYLGSSAGSDGAAVPDGEYTYAVTVTDSGELTGTSTPQTVVIDNTPPTATASAEYAVFSPDGDGRRDTVTLTQESSTEDSWSGSIVSGGSAVLDVTWTGAVPSSYVWDGMDLAGRDLDDGDYVYQLTSTDRAGNTFTLALPAVTIDTAERPLSLSVDSPAFSPNGDGSRDTLRLSFGSVVLDRLTSAVITVSDSGGTELQSVEVGTLIGSPVVFNGYVNEAGTVMIPEGVYQVSVTADYEHGPHRESGPVSVEVDITPPSAVVSSSASVFSPEGDGLKDTVVVTHSVEGQDSWRGFVFVAGGDVLQTFDFGSDVPASVVWNGNDLNGNAIADGTYSYQLIGTDVAGNQTSTDPISVTIDRRATTMDIEFSRRYFSPNGDGQGDTVTVTPNLSVPTGIDEYTVTVMNSAGEELGSGTGEGNLPTAVVWDGSDLGGNTLPEGDYVAELELVYEKGNEPVGLSPVLTIDNTVPRASLLASSTGFTPDGDGDNDTIMFTPVVTPPEGIIRYSGRIEALDGTVVRQVETTIPGFAVWDGRTSRGTVAADGGYVAILEVEHRNGTIVEARTGTIALGDVELPAQMALELSTNRFSPDGDGVNDTVSISLEQQGGAAVSSWEIRVYDDNGNLFHSFPVGGSRLSAIEWDGYNSAGELVEMASEYDVRYEVEDVGGYTAQGSETLTVDVLTEPGPYGGRRILVDNVLFEGYTTRYLYWDNDAEARNVTTLEKIGDILRMFPEYSIELQGHAVSVLYYNEEASDFENENVLLPLSVARTQVILDLFEVYGADPDKFTLTGYGKLRPLVPFSNLDERAINRRVEFYLVD